MDHGALSIMVPAFAECLVLVGIHSYLGLHVIKRKVIFVDLALAQIAALGATVGFLFGMDPTSRAAFIFSMAFTFVGAAIFAMTRFRRGRVSQEAVIGLVYALAVAITILVIDKSPHGAEHIKDLLTGTILWVKWPEIISSAIAYAFVGVFHYLLRHRFIRITEDPEGAFADGVWVRLWDFLFYISFGFVITFSVRTAGVLLVFVFLVAPAISAVLITDRWRTQLLIGWGLGTAVTSAALLFSYVLDLPSGPTVVASYGAVLLVLALAVYLLRAPAEARAPLRTGVGLASVVVLVGALWGLGTALGGSSLALDPSRHIVRYSYDQDAADRSGKTATEEDPTLRLQQLKQRAKSRQRGWRSQLVDAVLDRSLPLLFRDEALQLLQQQAGETFNYDPESENNAAATSRMRAWARKE